MREKLKTTIKQKKIPQKEIAEKIGESEQVVSHNLNSGNITLDFFVRVCEAIGERPYRMLMTDKDSDNCVPPDMPLKFYKISKLINQFPMEQQNRLLKLFVDAVNLLSDRDSA